MDVLSDFSNFLFLNDEQTPSFEFCALSLSLSIPFAQSIYFTPQTHPLSNEKNNNLYLVPNFSQKKMKTNGTSSTTHTHLLTHSYTLPTTYIHCSTTKKPGLGSCSAQFMVRKLFCIIFAFLPGWIGWGSRRDERVQWGRGWTFGFPRL